jgi:ABC-type bacteriocin/lantibiotic exporter with double-glycine peptidase domain
MNIKETIYASFRTLTKRERRRVAAVAGIQVGLGFLDLIGVALIGVIGSLAVNGIQSRGPGTRITTILGFLGLEDVTFQNQVAILGIGAATVLVSRTLISMFFSKKIFHFLARRAAVTSNHLVTSLLNSPLRTIRMRSKQETIFAVTEGVNMMMLNIIGTVVGVTSDLFLLLILSIGLFVVNPFIAVATFLTFGTVGLLMYFSVNKKVNALGNANAQLAILSFEKISDAITNYKELYVRDRRNYYIQLINDSRKKIAWNSAELSFIPNLGKYLIEVTMVIGGIVICAFQFMFADASQAISILSVFLAAGSRIAPAILRVQSGAIAIKGSYGAASRTISLMKQLGLESEIIDEKDLDKVRSASEFRGVASVRNLSFSYETESPKILDDVSLEIFEGEILAIVGPSGAGKSTLVDILLGLYNPTSGEVTISQQSPRLAVKAWPGSISYVPQEVSLVSGSVAENIALGYPFEQIDLERVNECIDIAQLREYVAALPTGINTHIGESALQMSGGQLQRLGIARALYTNPKLLVMDEATSSLDGKTELGVSDAIVGLRGTITTILIAHRLATVLKADRLAYLENGKILAVGSFDQIKAQIPEFEYQASLMGL